MVFTSFYDIINPKLKRMTAMSPAGTFYNILAESLNEWFDKELTIQLCAVTGTVTSPAGTVIPFYNNGLKPIAESLYITAKDLKGFALMEEKTFPAIFNYIGKKLAKATLNWSTTSSLWAKFLGLSSTIYTNPIVITAKLTNSISTAHFYKFGENFIKKIKNEPPENPNTYKVFWNEFENFLKDAMIKTPLVFTQANGITPAGVFNGTATIKLIINPGDN